MTLYLLVSGSIFLLSFLFISHTGKVNLTANRWLGVFFFCAGCALVALPLTRDYPALIPYTEFTRFAMAPAIYLSVLHFTGARARWVYLHFVPAMLFILLMVPMLVAGHPLLELPRLMGFVMAHIIKVQFLIYWILAIYKVRNQPWLRYLLWSVFGLMVLWFAGVTPYTAVVYLLGVYLIGYFALRQKDYQVRPPLVPALNNHKERLEDLMTRERVFTDSDLNLPLLATKMGISVHDLSALLNNGFGKNFNQFVNDYRVELAKELLRSEKHTHLSILGIAFEAGFNSKTTFNTTFKKATGVSPSDWKKSGSEL